MARLTASFSVAASMAKSTSPNRSTSVVTAFDAAHGGVARVRLIIIWRWTWRSMVALDRLEAGFQPLGRDIVQHDVEAGQRADVRDAVAHLACADHADGANAGHADLTPVLATVILR